MSEMAFSSPPRWLGKFELNLFTDADERPQRLDVLGGLFQHARQIVRRALEMLIAPDAIKQTTVLHAYAQAVEAGAAARRVLEASR